MNINTLEVWMDAATLGPMLRIGTLHHDRGNIRFEYTNEWLTHANRFAVDPHLMLSEGTFHPHPNLGSFGMLLDSSPDRWGQTLMKRREVLLAQEEGRKTRTLYAWDYLLGVQDLTRQGALRFKPEGSAIFLGDHKRAAPPVTHLHELEGIAWELSSKRIEDLNALRRWLGVLVAPGSSLGGARPKANFTEKDGSLWIAKFPAKDDDRDAGAWEMLTHGLAVKSKINVPAAKLCKFGNAHHTFCIKRFDRESEQRIFYASAMNLLSATKSEGYSYLDLAQLLQNQGDPNFIGKDLEQLFRRVIFNVLVGNRDDHLRNHGFILCKDGWRLSPAFDVNPNIDKADHVLNLDDSNSQPNVQTIIETAEFYQLTKDKALKIFADIAHVVSNWRSDAQKLRIANADIQLMSSAFWHFEEGDGRTLDLLG